MRTRKVKLLLSFAALATVACSDSIPDQSQSTAHAQAPQKNPVGCSPNMQHRTADTATIGPAGGSIFIGNPGQGSPHKYAIVHFQKDAYSQAQLVTVTPHPDEHGVKISPAPNNDVLLQLSTRVCNDPNPSGGEYGFITDNAADPAVWVIDGNGQIRWATGVVKHTELRTASQADDPLFSGFVILSN